MTSTAKTPGDVLQEINRASAGMVEKLFRDMPAASGPADVAALMRLFASADAGQVEKLRALEETFYRDHFSLWGQLAAPDKSGADPAEKGDARFAAAEWQLPFFRYLQQAYLLNARWTTDMVHGTGEILVLLSGIDEAFAQTVYARSSYRSDEIRWNARFRSMFLAVDAKSHVSVDISRIHDIEPV